MTVYIQLLYSSDRVFREQNASVDCSLDVPLLLERSEVDRAIKGTVEMVWWRLFVQTELPLTGSIQSAAHAVEQQVLASGFRRNRTCLACRPREHQLEFIVAT